MTRMKKANAFPVSIDQVNRFFSFGHHKSDSVFCRVTETGLGQASPLTVALPGRKAALHQKGASFFTTWQREYPVTDPRQCKAMRVRQTVQFRICDDVIIVNTPTRAALLHAVRARFLTRQGFALATLNLDHLVKLRAEAPFRAAYMAHDLVVADGNPIVWLSRLARRPVDLVTGSDLLRPMLQLAASQGVRVAFFGGSPDVLAAAKTRLMTDISGLDVVWTGSPPMGFDPNGPVAEAALAAMQSAGAGLCILSLSAPRQEMFAVLGRHLTPRIGFCSFGAGLDFVVGQQVRAPVWVRNVAMEWLWRALSQPRRLMPRYGACAAILPKLMVEALRQRP
jgi:N-acetylglucosaminyldiphosphoundecaprenol N-acetyl-beta-D-mannosaminyltransferase